MFSVLPHLSEHLRITQLCKAVGLTIDIILLFKGEAVTVNGKLHSSEYDQNFSVQDAKLQPFKERYNPDKLKLSINGQNIIDWFKQKYQELKQPARPYIRPATHKVGDGKGFKR